VKRSSYEVTLLEINMADLSGVRFLDRLRRRDRLVPCVAAVTPKNKHVISDNDNGTPDQGFEPPVDKSFGESPTIASRRTAARRSANVMEALPSAPAFAKQQLSRIAIKAEGKILLVDPVHVIAFEAKGNHLLMLHTSGSYMLRDSILVAEKKLSPQGFIRIHRSVLVNATFVEEIRQESTGRYLLRIKGGKEYKVSRTYKANLQRLAESWIGTAGFSAK
jgi:two-component system LytT family response regulator